MKLDRKTILKLIEFSKFDVGLDEVFHELTGLTSNCYTSLFKVKEIKKILPFFSENHEKNLAKLWSLYENEK